jgi:hypothetical protein
MWRESNPHVIAKNIVFFLFYLFIENKKLNSLNTSQLTPL